MPTPGRTSVGRYELRKRLGIGGMGTVWHAWDPALQRDVAVKEVLLPEGMTPEDRAEAHARTLREAQATARISHTSVVTIHDVLDHDKSPWIVMELLSGSSLQHRLDTGGPMPVERVEQAARALLGGLRAAHAAGVTHRDVKPANIMLTEDDRTVLTDFGIANVDGSAALTQTGVYIGSPEYMAPERFEGERALPASDLWSLGVTLYSLLEGRSPFKRDSITGMISAVLTAPVPPQLVENEDAQTPRSLALRALIGALLTRDVAARPSPQEALELLERERQAAQRHVGTEKAALPDLGAVEAAAVVGDVGTGGGALPSGTAGDGRSEGPGDGQDGGRAGAGNGGPGGGAAGGATGAQRPMIPADAVGGSRAAHARPPQAPGGPYLPGSAPGAPGHRPGAGRPGGPGGASRPGGPGSARPGGDTPTPDTPSPHHTPASHNTPSPYGGTPAWGQHPPGRVRSAQAGTAQPQPAPAPRRSPVGPQQPPSGPQAGGYSWAAPPAMVAGRGAGAVGPGGAVRPAGPAGATAQGRPGAGSDTAPDSAAAAGTDAGARFLQGTGHTGTNPDTPVPAGSGRGAGPDAAKPAPVLTAMVMLGLNALVLFVLTALSAGQADDPATDTTWGSVVVLGLWGVLSAFAAFGLPTRSRLVFALVVIVQGIAAVSLAMSMFTVFIYTPELMVIYALMLLYTLGIGGLLLVPGASRAYFGLG